MNPESLSHLRIARRGLLFGAVGLGVGACGSNSTSSDDSADAANVPFSIAHRGGGRNWPEMTLYAYQQAAEYKGLSGMEVSVHRSRDGVLVCSHDPDTHRVGSKNLRISTSTWSELSSVLVLPKNTTDPSQPGRPLTRLDDLLAWWPVKMPLWIEPKAPDAVEPLQKALQASRVNSIVWKQPINSTNFQFAQDQGWRTWGYVLTGKQQQSYVSSLASSSTIDMLGAWNQSTDAEVGNVVAQAGDKPTVMWQIDDAEQRARALRLGCKGLMVANVKKLVER